MNPFAFLSLQTSREAKRFFKRRLAPLFPSWKVGGLDRSVGSKPIARHRYTPPSQADMQAAYQHSAARKLEDTFVLYRILGNDLTPRHAKGQTRKNLTFILDHEPEFPNCEKRFILNRIVDPDEEMQIVELLEAKGFAYSIIPYDPAIYLQTEWDQAPFLRNNFVFSEEFKTYTPRLKGSALALMRRHKNLYAINNNGARNFALSEGRTVAKWVLPFDGNCFFTQTAFDALRQSVLAEPWHPYWIVPMARVVENQALLVDGVEPVSAEEPQIVFRCDAEEAFDETIPYGRRPKVNLLWRLGVPGVWDKYRLEAWDLPMSKPARQIGWFKKAGWVARLNSGRPDLEAGRQAAATRTKERDISVSGFLDRLDGRRFEGRYDCDALALYDTTRLSRLSRFEPKLADALGAAAHQALGRGPYSVLDKRGRAPSGNPHDYFSQAPYWWPDEERKNGLPYARRDGQAFPGTKMFSEGSERFDRTAFQRFCDDTTVLALAGHALGDQRCLDHGALLVRTWFLKPETAMTPHLSFAQVRLGHSGDEGSASGIVDFRDLARVLDAVRLLAGSGVLSTHEQGLFREWLSAYVTWLCNSPQGMSARHAINNIGTFYDLQVASIARFLGDDVLLSQARNWARLRLSAQIKPDGAMPHEYARRNRAHYIAFTLAGWNDLARTFDETGEDVWSWTGSEGQGLADAYQWLVDAFRAGTLVDPDEREFDSQRLEPFWTLCRERLPAVNHVPEATGSYLQPLLDPDFSILPFWQLGR